MNLLSLFSQIKLSEIKFPPQDQLLWGYNEIKLFRKLFKRERRLSRGFSMTEIKSVNTELAALADYLHLYL